MDWLKLRCCIWIAFLSRAKMPRGVGYSMLSAEGRRTSSLPFFSLSLSSG